MLNVGPFVLPFIAVQAEEGFTEGPAICSTYQPSLSVFQCHSSSPPPALDYLCVPATKQWSIIMGYLCQRVIVNSHFSIPLRDILRKTVFSHPHVTCHTLILFAADNFNVFNWRGEFLNNRAIQE